MSSHEWVCDYNVLSVEHIEEVEAGTGWNRERELAYETAIEYDTVNVIGGK